MNGCNRQESKAKEATDKTKTKIRLIPLKAIDKTKIRTAALTKLPLP